MEIITIDKAGRLIIPASIRKKMAIDDGTKFLVVNLDNKIILEKLDRKEIAKRLQEELKDVDIDSIAHQIEAEMNERIREERKNILS